MALPPMVKQVPRGVSVKVNPFAAKTFSSKLQIMDYLADITDSKITFTTPHGSGLCTISLQSAKLLPKKNLDIH